VTESRDPLAWLFGLEQFGIKYDLENIGALVGELGHPERAFRSVHIAGTNGKGSVTAMVDAALLAAGHRSARYTSPHLVDLAERFVVGGRPIDRPALEAALADVERAAERLQAGGGLSGPPTFFEAATAAAFELFRRAGTELAVLEVGLGGRLDATNVIRPEATAITSIGFDHQRYLGNTLPDIAREKAGIIKPGVPVVVGRMDAEAERAIGEVARGLGAPIVRAWDGVRVDREAGGRADPHAPSRVRITTPGRDYGEIELALRGDHQIDNAVVAVRLLEILHARGIDAPAGAIVDGLASVHWPGRLDRRRLPDGREALLDAAHNPQGAAALAVYLASVFPSRLPLVCAVMRDKDAAGILQPLAHVVSAIVATRASNPRSADPPELAAIAHEVAPDLPIEIEAAPRDALAAAWRRSPRIVVAGSIFLLGDVMTALGGP
jgi:dihydrofolate synthase/folylpolyglutamate synthase